MAFSNEFDVGKNIVLQYKNNVLNNPEKHDRKNICHQLENPSQIILNQDGEMAWIAHIAMDAEQVGNQMYEKKEINVSTQVFLAPPILMALCVKRYDLVKGLVEAGYSTVNIVDKKVCCQKWLEELVGSCVIEDCIFKISLGQFILGDPDMPDDLRLYLWHQVAAEKTQLSKVNRKPRGKVIDFFKISPQSDICACFFGSKTSNVSLYPETIFKSLNMIFEKRPRYLKNIISDDWAHILQYEDCDFTRKLVFFLLEKVVYRDKQKRYILKLHSCKPMVYPKVEWLKIWVNFDYQIEKYFREKEALRKEFLRYILLQYQNYIIDCNDDIEFTFQNPNEKKVLRLIKKYAKDNITIRQFLGIFVEYLTLVKGGLDEVLKLYKEITGRRIVMDDSVIFEESQSFFSPKIEDHGGPLCIGFGYYPKWFKWIEYVDSFSYDDSLPLNELQKHILQTGGPDWLMFSMRRGLLQGKHKEAALEFCMEKEELHAVIPCIMAG